LCQYGNLSVLSSCWETKKVEWVGERRSSCFWSRILRWERKCSTIRCRDATASIFIANVQGEVFAHFHIVIKRNSMRNWLFGLPEQIIYEQFPWCQRKWLSCSWICSSPVSNCTVCPKPSVPFKRLMLSSPNVCLILAKVSPHPRFAPNLMHTRCRSRREIASGQIHGSK
jgi:hypothetical protein